MYNDFNTITENMSNHTRMIKIDVKT